MGVRVLVLGLCLITAVAHAQIGPGEFDAPVGEDASVGEGSQPFIEDPDAGDAPSIGGGSQPFIDDPSAGEAPSIGDANEPFDEQPAEGAPFGRGEPFGE